MRTPDDANLQRLQKESFTVMVRPIWCTSATGCSGNRRWSAMSWFERSRSVPPVSPGKKLRGSGSYTLTAIPQSCMQSRFDGVVWPLRVFTGVTLSRVLYLISTMHSGQRSSRALSTLSPHRPVILWSRIAGVITTVKVFLGFNREHTVCELKTVLKLNTPSFLFRSVLRESTLMQGSLWSSSSLSGYRSSWSAISVLDESGVCVWHGYQAKLQHPVQAAN